MSSPTSDPPLGDGGAGARATSLDQPESEPDRPVVHWPRWAGLGLLALVVAGICYAVVWRLDGGRWERVETASMGTHAPVGTLLWIKPVDFRDLKVGDFITFHPPGQSGVTYSHLVHVIHPDGTIGTKGELTAPDPWRLRAGDVVGKVVRRWWGIGWIVEAAPVLLIGAAVLALLLWRGVPKRWRLPTATTGVALIVSLAIVVYRPLVRAQQLAFVPVHGGGRATYVSTGLLPLRMQSLSGQHVRLTDGQVGSVLSLRADAHGRYPVSLKPDIPLLWWILLVLVCFLPAIWTLLVGLRPSAAARHRADDADAAADPDPGPSTG